MIFLNREEIEAAISLDEIMDEIERAYTIYREKKYVMPDRITVENGAKTLQYMPCFIEDQFATKCITIFPENRALGKPTIDGVVLLNDYVTGEPIAIMDAKAITGLRTGAVGGVGVRHLSKKDAKSVGVIGAGVQGFNQLLYACTARDITHVYAYDAFAKDLSGFMARLKAALPDRDITYTACESAEELVKASDIIITATTSNTPVIPDNKELLEGKCFIGIGSFKPHMREYPAAIMSAVDKVYIDLDFACEETGDLAMPLKEGILTMDRVELMSDFLVSGANEEEITKKTTFFKTVGMALFDVTVAQAIYKNAVAKGIGQKINF